MMSNRLRRDPYWFDRILEHITATLDPEYPYHLAGARVVVTGTDVAVYVTIPDTLVRFNARQRWPAHYDRTTTVINVVEALADDDLDQLKPDPPGDIDRELAELDLPPIVGWRVHPEWPEEMIDDAIGGTCRIVADTLHDVDAVANGLDYSSHRDAIDGATNDVLHGALQRPVAFVGVDDGRLLVPARLVFSARLLGLPETGWQTRDRGPWQALTVQGIDLYIATSEPAWVVERTA
jgi:hypothetical protein